MKKILIILLTTVTLFGWETTTHRAIDREAIKKSINLESFIEDSKIDGQIYDSEEFEGYGFTYLNYIKRGENNGISKWGQEFNGIPSYQAMIEAGTILEDAQWPHWLDGGEYNYYDIGDGRFNNHFADPQNGYKGLWLGGGSALTKSALTWATDVESNKYDYKDALDYFVKGFTFTTAEERKTYQAKMFVSVGHLMHLMNDMNVPAHVRDDAHPKGDALEWWARGGENADQEGGFRISGSTLSPQCDATVKAKAQSAQPYLFPRSQAPAWECIHQSKLQNNSIYMGTKIIMKEGV